MTTGLSFADVRDYARNGEEATCVDFESLEVIMANELRVLWASLPMSARRVHHHFDTVAGTSSYTLSGGTSRIFDLSSGPCPLERRPPVCDTCTGQEAAAGGEPRSWSIDVDGKLVLDPVPDAVYRIDYYQAPDLTSPLYTVVSNEKVWNLVPIPEKYIGVYKTMVRAKGIIEQDPGRGAMIYNSAISDLRVLVSDESRSVNDGRLVLNRDAVRPRRGAQSEPFLWRLEL